MDLETTTEGVTISASSGHAEYWMYDPSDKKEHRRTIWPIVDYASLFIQMWKEFVENDQRPTFFSYPLSNEGLVSATIHFQGTSGYVQDQYKKLLAYLLLNEESIKNKIGLDNFKLLSINLNGFVFDPHRYRPIGHSRGE